MKSGMRNMNRSLHISDPLLTKIDNGYEDEIDLTLVTLDYFRIHFLSYIGIHDLVKRGISHLQNQDNASQIGMNEL